MLIPLLASICVAVVWGGEVAGIGRMPVIIQDKAVIMITVIMDALSIVIA